MAPPALQNCLMTLVTPDTNDTTENFKKSCQKIREPQ